MHMSMRTVMTTEVSQFYRLDRERVPPHHG
jgi:hypothetical protein